MICETSGVGSLLSAISQPETPGVGLDERHTPPNRGMDCTTNHRGLPWECTLSHLIRDRDASYGVVFKRRLDSLGIRDHPTAPHSPWQNGYAERIIGSIRRECLDHTIILGEAHLRRTLKSYAQYYNRARTHLSLGKDSPIHRPIQRQGSIISHPHLGGIHHEYARTG